MSIGLVLIPGISHASVIKIYDTDAPEQTNIEPTPGAPSILVDGVAITPDFVSEDNAAFTTSFTTTTSGYAGGTDVAYLIDEGLVSDWIKLDLSAADSKGLVTVHGTWVSLSDGTHIGSLPGGVTLESDGFHLNSGVKGLQEDHNGIPQDLTGYFYDSTSSTATALPAGLEVYAASSVPEPSETLMFSLGLVGLSAVARLRSKKTSV